MTTRKVHLHKQEESVMERGLQIRSEDPIEPIENQVWVDTTSKKINLYKNGIKVSIGSDGINSAEETFVLNKDDILNKKVTLSKYPVVNSLQFLPEGGIYQRKDIDFSIDGKAITWDGLYLDNFLQEGETIQINYLFTDELT